ncbi:MAG: hypothetical protein ABUT39_19395 [Acidobacteriota bacterium]
MAQPKPQPKAKPKPTPVGFKLPAGTKSNAKNLQVPGSVIDQSADPWSILSDPYGVPTPAQQAQWNQLCCQRYGQPKSGFILPEPGGALHSTDYQAALTAIAQLDPGWFVRMGFGPGPSGPNPSPTQVEYHDAQYAQGISDQVIQHARELQLAQTPK